MVLLVVCMMLVMTAAVSAVKVINNGKTNTVESNQIPIDNEIESEESKIKEFDEEITKTPTTKTGFVMVPAAAFVPCYGYIDNWENTGGSVKGTTYFVAPVYLRHGATVTALHFHWFDGIAADGSVHLVRYDNLGNEVILAEASTMGSTGYFVTKDFTIDYADVDNFYYGYYLFFFSNEVSLMRVVIEYSYTTGSSSTDLSEIQQTHEPNVPLSR